MRRLITALLLLASIIPKLCEAQNWAPLPFRFNRNDVRYIVDPTENVMYFGGGFDTVNGVATRIVKWDGVSITYLNTTFGASDVITYKNRLFVNAGGIVFRYDTSSWTQINNYDALWGKFYPAGDKIIVGLFRTDSTGKESTPMAVWDGNTPRDTLQLDTLWKDRLWGFQSLAWYKGELYIGGLMYPEDHPLINLIARFDGARWKDVGGGIRAGGFAHINQLLVWKNDLYVAGQFLETAGAPGNCIARWDGSRWHRLGGGVYKFSGSEADIQKMVVHNDELYVAGFFTSADGIPAPGIAKWNGKKWCTVNDDFGSQGVNDVVTYKGNLFVGGGGHSINGDSAFNHLAKYIGSGFDDECSIPLSVTKPVHLIDLETVYPNPAGNTLYIRADDVKSTAIIDVMARTLTSYSGYDSAKGIDISSLRPGIYIVRIERAKAISALRFVKQ